MTKDIHGSLFCQSFVLWEFLYLVLEITFRAEFHYYDQEVLSGDGPVLDVQEVILIIDNVLVLESSKLLGFSLHSVDLSDV